MCERLRGCASIRSNIRKHLNACKYAFSVLYQAMEAGGPPRAGTCSWLAENGSPDLPYKDANLQHITHRLRNSHPFGQSTESPPSTAPPCGTVKATSDTMLIDGEEMNRALKNCIDMLEDQQTRL